MITNTSITTYHKGYDAETRLNTWERHYYSNVWWFGGKGASLNTGLTNANDYRVRIPYNTNENLNIADFSIGDIVLYGNGPKNITSQQDLQEYEFFIITSINNNTFSVDKNEHIHIGGK